MEEIWHHRQGVSHGNLSQEGGNGEPLTVSSEWVSSPQRGKIRIEILGHPHVVSALDAVHLQMSCLE